MGLENCDSNVWAVTLKETVVSKLMVEDALEMEEGKRNELMVNTN
jgi:hypothetical protein